MPKAKAGGRKKDPDAPKKVGCSTLGAKQGLLMLLLDDDDDEIHIRYFHILTNCLCAATVAQAMGAYMFFCADRRESLKKQFPDLKVTEMASKLGALWKEMNDDQKKPYQAKAEKDKERYAKAMAEYNS